MSNISLSRERFFITDSFAYDLEFLAERLTKDNWVVDEKAHAIAKGERLQLIMELGLEDKQIVQDIYAGDSPKDRCAPSLTEPRITAMFYSASPNEEEMSLRLALTDYFFLTGRPLLPAMVGLMREGIAARQKNRKPWGRQNVKPESCNVHQCLVVAIDNKFPRRRKSIGMALGITAEGVKKKLQNAIKDKRKVIVAAQMEALLPENIDDCLYFLRNQFEAPYFKFKLNCESELGILHNPMRDHYENVHASLSRDCDIELNLLYKPMRVRYEIELAC